MKNHDSTPRFPGAKTTRPRSFRARLVAKWFGLTDDRQANPPSIQKGATSLFPRVGQVLLISGPSGSGKSSLLRELLQSSRDQYCIDLNQIELPDVSVIDCLGAIPMEQALGVLSRFGLAEAWTYLKTPQELSDGQRWRLRLAIALVRASERKNQLGPILVCDEFCALLDRVTACIVSRSLRRAVDASRLSAIVATSHDDLLEALCPDMHARCDFGSIEVQSIKQKAFAIARSTPARQTPRQE